MKKKKSYRRRSKTYVGKKELERIGIDYNVEIRDVPGCFNIPEEQTVVIARGKKKERFFSTTAGRDADDA